MVTTSNIPNRKSVDKVLESIMDPEIPVLSINDLGMISDVLIDEYQNKIHVKFLPTFIGCPAINILKTMIYMELKSSFDSEIEVTVDYDIAWNSNRITDEGKSKLEKFGIAAPSVKSNCKIEASDFLQVTCPHCKSNNTKLRSPFGSTLCRAMHYCSDCRQMFEQFKPVV